MLRGISDTGLHHMTFKIGDRVQWIRAVPDATRMDNIGIVTAVIPDDNNPDEFSLYSIKFNYGIYTLYGTQLRAVKDVLSFGVHYFAPH